MGPEGLEHEIKRYIEEMEDLSDKSKKKADADDDGTEVTQQAIPTPLPGTKETKVESRGVVTPAPIEEKSAEKKVIIEDAEFDSLLSGIDTEVTTLLSGPVEQLTPELEKIMRGHRVMEMSVKQREEIFNKVARHLKKKDNDATLQAFEDVAEEAEKQGWDLGSTERAELMSQKAAEISDLYTIPYQELYHWLKIGPAYGGNTVLD